MYTFKEKTLCFGWIVVHFLNTLFLKEVSFEIELISKYKYQSFKYTDLLDGLEAYAIFLFFSSQVQLGGKCFCIRTLLYGCEFFGFFLCFLAICWGLGVLWKDFLDGLATCTSGHYVPSLIWQKFKLSYLVKSGWNLTICLEMLNLLLVYDGKLHHPSYFWY